MDGKAAGGAVPVPKIRCLTAFVELPRPSEASWQDAWGPIMQRAAAFLKEGAAKLTAITSLEVQTTRIATQPFEEYVNPDQAVDAMRLLETLATEHGVTFVAMGPGRTKEGLAAAVAVASCSTTANISYDLGAGGSHAGIREEVYAVAKATLDIADATDGQGNFRFAVACNVPPGTPYFPVSYCGKGQGNSFAVGLENDVILNLAFSRCEGRLNKAADLLHEALFRATAKVQSACEAIAGASGWKCYGVDASIVPGLDTPDMSTSVEKIGLGLLGRAGSLSAAALITAACKRLATRGIHLCGYSGLMLPVLEDKGLAQAAREGRLTVQKLLMYSSVCGTGLDTVPVPGRASDAGESERIQREIAAVMLDTWSLAYRLSKPLAVRLLPLPGHREGDEVDFKSKYMVPGVVMSLAE